MIAVGQYLIIYRPLSTNVVLLPYNMYPHSRSDTPYKSIRVVGPACRAVDRTVVIAQDFVGLQ